MASVSAGAIRDRTDGHAGDEYNGEQDEAQGRQRDRMPPADARQSQRAARGNDGLAGGHFERLGRRRRQDDVRVDRRDERRQAGRQRGPGRVTTMSSIG